MSIKIIKGENIMCKKNVCQNCNSCPMKYDKKKSSWQEEQPKEDLRLELDTLCQELKMLRHNPDENKPLIQELEYNLLTTYNHAVKVGLTYTLDEI